MKRRKLCRSRRFFNLTLTAFKETSFLQNLATYHRNYCKTKVICLTGSNGKTTTKELLHAVLSERFTTLATAGNFNNHIGVPLTLLRLRPEHEYAVVELGANHMGEIKLLSQIAQPDFGFITNFGKAHIEGFGSIENIVRGKMELFDYLISNEKTVFYHANDERQCKELNEYPNKHPYGLSADLKLLQATPQIELQYKQAVIKSELFGSYNADNISAAIAVGSYFEVSDEQIAQAISAYRPSNMRSQLLTKGEHEIVLDHITLILQGNWRYVHSSKRIKKIAYLYSVICLNWAHTAQLNTKTWSAFLKN